MIYSSTHVEDGRDGAGLRYGFDTESSVIGRVGFRLKDSHGYGDGKQAKGLVTSYLKANLWGNLLGGDSVMEAGVTPVASDGKSLWADAGMGLSIQASENTEIFVDGDAEYGLDQDYKALTGKLGMRLNW